MQDRPMQRMAVILEREVVESRWESHRWDLLGVVPVRWTGPSLTSDQPKVLTETLEIAHHGFQVKG